MKFCLMHLVNFKLCIMFVREYLITQTAETLFGNGACIFGVLSLHAMQCAVSALVFHNGHTPNLILLVRVHVQLGAHFDHALNSNLLLCDRLIVRGELIGSCVHVEVLHCHVSTVWM